jgi:uncharacterized membrane protein
VIRALIRLAILGLIGGWLVDRWMRDQAGGGPPPPLSSLVVIDAPIERVWAELADIEGQPRWMHEMKSVRLLTPPPTGVGTRGEATVRIFGISVTDPVEVTEFEPPCRFAIRHEGAFTGGGVITLESGPGEATTVVRWDETLIAPLLPHLWARLSAPIIGGIFQADLGHFRDLVEAAPGQNEG